MPLLKKRTGEKSLGSSFFDNNDNRYETLLWKAKDNGK